MAPGAQLYLFCIDSEVALAQAEQDAIADGVKIINESASVQHQPGRRDWRLGHTRRDRGRCPGARDSLGNSAGNYGDDHWAGRSRPTRTTRTSSISHPGWRPTGSRSSSASRPACSSNGTTGRSRARTSTWASSQRRPHVGRVVEPTSRTRRRRQPTLCYTNTGPTRASGSRSRATARANPRFDLYYSGESALQFANAGSVTDPPPRRLRWPSGRLLADEHARALQLGGADDRRPHEARPPRSGQRLDPDLGAATAGAGGCGTSGFAGTSAASPQVAGAAADLLQRHPSYTTGQLVASLEETTFAYGQNGTSDTVVNDDSGAGPLRLGLAAPLGTIAYDAGGTPRSSPTARRSSSSR